jgi:Rrf2 family cysteine metabolism transcriptional repressor
MGIVTVNLTSKSRYALKIMMDLAHFGANQALVRRSEIAARQGIPTDYLDQIMIKLRAGRLVESTRGRTGGYRLARSPEKITMWDLFTSVEDSMIPVECLASGEACDFETSCSSRESWKKIFVALKSSLGEITLAQLCSDWEKERQETGVMPATVPTLTVRECRGGGRVEINSAGDGSDLMVPRSADNGGNGLHG